MSSFHTQNKLKESLLQNYLNQFPDLNPTKAQFAEVRQIFSNEKSVSSFS